MPNKTGSGTSSGGSSKGSSSGVPSSGGSSAGSSSGGSSSGTSSGGGVNTGSANSGGGSTSSSSSHYVVLAWERSVSSVMGYNIYRAVHSGGPYQKINRILEPATSYTDRAVGAGKRYYYVVTSVDAAAESAHSREIAVLIPTP